MVPIWSMTMSATHISGNILNVRDLASDRKETSCHKKNFAVSLNRGIPI